MKKSATLFSDSYAELKQMRTLTIMAMFGAISIVPGYFTIIVGDYIEIRFSTIAGQMVYYLFGSAVEGCFSGVLDILKHIMKLMGAFFSRWTFGAILAGVLYGMVFYKKPLTPGRVLSAGFLVSLICNVLLGTLWLNIMYSKASLALLPMRAFKNLAMWSVNFMLFYTIAKTVETTGILRITRGVKLVPGNNQ